MTTALLGMGLGVSGVAMSASAHHNTVSGIAVCGVTPNTWEITWKVVNSESDLAEEISATSNSAVVPLHQSIAPGATYTKSEIVTSNAPRTLTVSGHWVRNGTDVYDNDKAGTVTSFPTGCASTAVKSVGLYIYKKLDSTKAASWPNSGLQTLIATWDGSNYATVFPGTLPSYVCGPGWGIQQDKINGAQSVFPQHMQYPSDGGMGWPPVYAAQHSELSDMIAVPDCPTVVTPVAPTVVTVQSCGTYGSVTPKVTTGVSYVVTSFDKNTGDYVVTATPKDGFKFSTREQSKTFTGNVGAYKSLQDCAVKPPQANRTVTTHNVDCSLLLTTTTTTYTTDYVWNTNTSKYELGTEVAGTPVVSTKTTTLDELKTLGVDAPSCILTAEAEPTDGVCAADGKTSVSGYITVDLKANVSYRIVGVGIDINPVTTAKTDVPAGDYKVTATATAPYTLSQSEWNLTVKADSCLTTLASWDANASATNQVCNSDGSTASGYITVDFIAEPGFEDAVQYFVGTTRLTSAKTEMAAGTYTVTAKTADPADTIVGDTSWPLTIAAPSGACPQLKTLAFTGADGSMGGMLIIALFLLLGGAGVYTASRVRSRES